MALTFKNACEKCNVSLLHESEAFICSHECTFCPTCTAEFKHTCPNCSGELTRRPKKFLSGMTNSILLFWFGDDIQKKPLQNSQVWFEKNPEFDGLVTKKYEVLLDKFSFKPNTPRESLAYMILFDQFPRNIYRENKKAFSYDTYALTEAQRGIGFGWDKNLHWIERSFYYLPFEHAENLENQKQALELFKSLRLDIPKIYEDYANETYKYAELHHNIIQKFGRFPHRNTILGRDSTYEEIEFLKTPNSSF